MNKSKFGIFEHASLTTTDTADDTADEEDDAADDWTDDRSVEIKVNIKTSKEILIPFSNLRASEIQQVSLIFQLKCFVATLAETELVGFQQLSMYFVLHVHSMIACIID